MSQSDCFDPPEPGDRPVCSNCGWTMWITLIEPHDGSDQVKETFKCRRCDYKERKATTIGATTILGI